MPPRTGVFSSSVGTKILVGVTGFCLFLYFLTHIAGNALAFFGPTVFNGYSHLLLSNPLIPVIEVGLVLIFIVHIFKTVKMYLSNLHTRPVAYARKEHAGPPSRKTFSSSTMIFSGLWLLVFVLIHVKQFKYGAEYVDPTTGIRDLYRLEMENFASPLLLAFYLLSMAVVGSHLWHGVASACQSVGISHSTWTPRLLVAGKVVAAIIAGTFMVIALWAHFMGGRL